MRVCVIGTGYVGLFTGACLAHIGHQVICVDNNEEKVKLMKAGRSPIFEPGLSEIMQSAIESGNIEFPTESSQSPTPFIYTLLTQISLRCDD
jgi:UDPglucose 6-dehydrogenase